MAFTGSVLEHIGAVRAAMVARLAIAVPGARVGKAAVDPLEGALWRARHGGNREQGTGTSRRGWEVAGGGEGGEDSC